MKTEPNGMPTRDPHSSRAAISSPHFQAVLSASRIARSPILVSAYQLFSFSAFARDAVTHGNL
jgi:hypothetical protein